jgi:large subunit ribosomal protein L6
MSRLGKQPVTIPSGVKVEINGRNLAFEGPKGRLSFTLPEDTSVEQNENQLVVKRASDEARSKALHGLSRAIINNHVTGVSKGFEKRLEISGVGFKAAMKGANLITLNLGYSHTIEYPIPDQVMVTVEENTKVLVQGPDKQKVGQVAAEIRSFYPVEPYNGKGVKYSDEQVIRKEGKTVQ